MSVRRRSNWYIYFIAFAIAMIFALVTIFAFKWYLFPEDSDPTGLTPSGDVAENFRPTAEHNFNSMVMLSDGVSGNPELFILVEYSAVENRLAFVPIPNGISIPKEGRSLPNVYAAQGSGKVVSVIEDILQIKCDSYVKFDRYSFIDLLKMFGNVNYETMKSLTIRDGFEVETLSVGVHRLAAESVFRLALLAEYTEGESYRFSSIGQMFSDLINQNFHGVDSSLLDQYAELIIENTETNLTVDKYTKYKAALLNTIDHGGSPAEYYVPYGDYNEDGGFVIAPNSLNTIHQRAGLD